MCIFVAIQNAVPRVPETYTFSKIRIAVASRPLRRHTELSLSASDLQIPPGAIWWSTSAVAVDSPNRLTGLGVRRRDVLPEAQVPLITDTGVLFNNCCSDCEGGSGKYE